MGSTRVALTASLLLALSVSGLAAADTGGTFLLSMGELQVGTVRATLSPEQAKPAAPNLVMSTTEVTPGVIVIVDGFVGGRALTTNLRLSTGAVVKKADRAKLTSVKLPSMGAGGAPELELGFLAPSVTTSPVLSLKQASAKTPAGSRIESFRVDVAGMPPIVASKLDAIVLVQKEAAGVTPSSDVALEVAAGGATPFVAWSKKPTPRTTGVEYVGPDGSALVKVKLESCAPSSVTPLGASGTTRVVLRCATAKPG
ncbi:MAG: hypothetical protein JST00_37665 [Deltaproteobacteria bacterium]|nr:hypothetical protein [Deltaproteobacteria bacterium]